MAVQRVGEEGGPTSVEYEVSETELDWFVMPSLQRFLS